MNRPDVYDMARSPTNYYEKLEEYCTWMEDREERRQLETMGIEKSRPLSPGLFRSCDGSTPVGSG